MAVHSSALPVPADPEHEMSAQVYRKKDDVIWVGAVPVLESVPQALSLVADETRTGVFLHAEGETQCHFWSVPLGRLASLDRFCACSRRTCTFWMEPCVGSRSEEVPGDTQWLLVRRQDGRFVLVVPLVADALRFTLEGRDGQLHLWADSGDPCTVCHSGVGVYLALGDDPYRLQEEGAVAVLRQMKSGALRRNKPLPELVDFFGWCTWNAFYRDVTEANVRTGLEGLRDGGIQPGFVILDDGWQSTGSAPAGGPRLTSLQPNGKFPAGLSPLISAVKRELGVKWFLVWHTMMGYWAGVDAGSLPDFDVQELARSDQPSFGRDMAPILAWMGTMCGVIPPKKIAAFFDAYHSRLATEGVDGVKVDNQSSIELSARGLGGRVRLSRAYRQALETSCRTHFGGRLINCMSNSNEMHVMAEDSTLMRTSTDFWPDQPETHGPHLYTNALVGMWFGQFIHPDWDMFQSAHPMGAFHAAGRAVSGSLVYVSDKPGCHDFDVLRRLVCSDGAVLRCRDIGRPTPDVLFHDPTREDVLLKIFNFNDHNAVIGVFNARHGTSHPTTGTISPSDIPGLPVNPYAVLAHRSGALRVLRHDETWNVELAPGEWDIFTFAPVDRERAMLGLADKYNSGGAVIDLKHESAHSAFTIRDQGQLVLYAARPPAIATVNNQPARIRYDHASGKAEVDVTAAGSVRVDWSR